MSTLGLWFFQSLADESRGHMIKQMIMTLFTITRWSSRHLLVWRDRGFQEVLNLTGRSIIVRQHFFQLIMKFRKMRMEAFLFYVMMWIRCMEQRDLWELAYTREKLILKSRDSCITAHHFRRHFFGGQIQQFLLMTTHSPFSHRMFTLLWIMEREMFLVSQLRRVFIIRRITAKA